MNERVLLSHLFFYSVSELRILTTDYYPSQYLMGYLFDNRRDAIF